MAPPPSMSVRRKEALVDRDPVLLRSRQELLTDQSG